MTHRPDDPPIEWLLRQRQQRGVLAVLEIDELAQRLELDDEALEDVYDEAGERGIEIRDDVGQRTRSTTYQNGDLTSTTTDAMRLFLNEVRRHPLLTAPEELALTRLVATLPDRHQDVLAFRYGLGGREPTTVREIGRRLGISAERVRQIEVEALELLAMDREIAAPHEAA